jgi:glyoxylase-like metal-dependent hydrolase (beta-lactamase superfamily II)
VRIAEGLHRVGDGVVNAYLIVEGTEVTIVDAAMPGFWPQLVAELASIGRSLEDVRALVLTHGHSDHIGFAEKVRTELDVPVYVHRDDEQLTTTGKALGKREASLVPYLRHAHAWKLVGHLASAGMPKPVQQVTTFGDGDELDVPGRPRVIHTPGHTSGHAALWFESPRVLVAGDLLCTLNPLTGARGPQLMPRGLNLSSATMIDSLTKIESLDAAVVVVGHGEPWTDGTADAVRRVRATGPT